MSDTPTSQAKAATLSRELGEFLIELSIGVHRYAMYPGDHPSLAPAVDQIRVRLENLFVDRSSLSIGVAQKQLVIEGVATDQKHPVLSELARRLHDHQLGAVSFERGVTSGEIAGLLGALAREGDRDETPLGLLPDESFPRWERARLYRVGYERLEIKGGGGVSAEVDRATALWLGLAQAALASDEPLGAAPDAKTVARSIAGHRREAAYDQVIVGYLLQLAEELKGEVGRESASVREQVSNLVKALDRGTLGRLLHFGGNQAQRKRFLLDANQSLAVESVVKVLEAASTSEEQSISNSMTRLLTKLAVHAEHGSAQVRSRADEALRENVEALIEGWELRDPNPEEYTTVLDAMAQAAPIFQAPDGEGAVSGPERIVQMALEVDAFGPIVSKAVEDFVAEGGTTRLLGLLEQAPESNEVAHRVKAHLTSPNRFREILERGQLDDAGIGALVAEMGTDAVEPLLGVLVDSDDRAVRRRAFDALAGMGASVAQRVVEHLDDERWYVLRNMLALLHHLGTESEDVDPMRFLVHPDQRVRREAFPLATQREELRTRALTLTLGDADDRLVRMALVELQEGVPDGVMGSLVSRVLKPAGRPDELRAMAARLLGGSTSPLAVGALVDTATAGRTLLGRPKLAPKSEASLAALRALAVGWSDAEEAAPVLARASRSRDPDVRGAVRVSSQARGAPQGKEPPP